MANEADININKLAISVPCQLVYDLYIEDKNYRMDLYLRKTRFSPFFELVITPGNIMSSFNGEFPARAVNKMDEMTVNGKFKPQDKFICAVNNESGSAKKCFEALGMKRNDKKEDCQIVIDGNLETIRVEVYTDKKGGELWVTGNDKYAVILKVVSNKYSNQLKAVNNYNVLSKISGDVIDKRTREKINSAEIKIEGADYDKPAAAGGSFTINLYKTHPLTENSIFMLIDNSSSMNDAIKGSKDGMPKNKMVENTASDLIKKLPVNAEMILHDFMSIDYTQERPFSFNKNILLNMLSKNSDFPGTPLGSSVHKIIDMLKNYATGRNQRVIVLTDGTAATRVKQWQANTKKPAPTYLFTP